MNLDLSNYTTVNSLSYFGVFSRRSETLLSIWCSTDWAPRRAQA